jgi:hypothetical protein
MKTRCNKMKGASVGSVLNGRTIVTVSFGTSSVVFRKSYFICSTFIFSLIFRSGIFQIYFNKTKSISSYLWEITILTNIFIR